MSQSHLLRGTLTALIVAGLPVSAQTTTGALRGVVTDVHGKPVAQAMVKLESPSLFAPTVLRTNARGEWRAQLLPVGNYQVKFSAPDCLGATLGPIRVGVGSDQTLNHAMKPLKVEAVVVEVVETAAAMEAKTADKVSANYSSDMLSQLPVSRSFAGAAFLTPGVSVDSSGNVTIRGSGGNNQVQYQINGIDVKDDFAGGTLYTPLQDSVEDIQVVMSTTSARNGRAMGGQVVMATRSGNNEFAGSVRAAYSRPTWSGDRAHARAWQTSENRADSISRTWEATLSGPIWKDKVWFYFGTRLEPTKTSIYKVRDASLSFNNPWPGETYLNPLSTYNTAMDKVLKDGPGGAYRTDGYLFDAGKAWSFKPDRSKYEGKLTMAVGANHTLSTTILDESSTEASAPATIVQLQYWWGVKSTRKANSLSWRGVLGDNLFLEADHYQAEFRKQEQLPALNPDEYASVMLNTGNGQYGTPNYKGDSWQFNLFGPGRNIKPEIHKNQNTKANLKGFFEAMGQHEMDFGFELYQSVANSGHYLGPLNRSYWAGGMYSTPSGDFLFPTIKFTGLNPFGQSVWRADGRRGPAPVVVQQTNAGGNATNKHDAFYLNDTWTLNDHWSVMGGLRWAKDTVQNSADTVINTFNHWEPRFQVKWDPRGNGTDVLTLSMARYSSSFTTQQTAGTYANGIYGIAGDAWSMYSAYGWTGAALPGGQADPGVTGDVMNGREMYGIRFVTLAQLRDMNNYSKAPYQVSDPKQILDWSGLEVPFVDELSLMYRRNYGDSWVSIGATRREYKKDWFSYSDYGMDWWKLVKDPTGVSDFGTWQQGTRITNSPFKRVFMDLELSWQEKLSGSFYWGGALTYQHQSITGDPVAYFQGQRLKQAAGFTPDQYAPGGVTERAFSAKAYWTFVQPLGKGNLSFSLLGEYYSGGAANMSQGFYLGSSWFQNSVKPGDPVWGANLYQGGKDPNGRDILAMSSSFASWTLFPYGGRGTYIAGNDTYDFTFKTQWQIPIYKKVILMGEVSVTSIFNRVIESRGYTDGAYDARYAPVGRLLYAFSRPWGDKELGSNNEANYWTHYRRAVGGFSVGVKF